MAWALVEAGEEGRDSLRFELQTQGSYYLSDKESEERLSLKLADIDASQERLKYLGCFSKCTPYPNQLFAYSRQLLVLGA
jgi:hypothetical protein